MRLRRIETAAAAAIADLDALIGEADAPAGDADPRNAQRMTGRNG